MKEIVVSMGFVFIAVMVSINAMILVMQMIRIRKSLELQRSLLESMMRELEINFY